MYIMIMEWYHTCNLFLLLVLPLAFNSFSTARLVIKAQHEQHFIGIIIHTFKCNIHLLITPLLEEFDSGIGVYTLCLAYILIGHTTNGIEFDRGLCCGGFFG